MNEDYAKYLERMREFLEAELDEHILRVGDISMELQEIRRRQIECGGKDKRDAQAK